MEKDGKRTKLSESTAGGYSVPSLREADMGRDLYGLLCSKCNHPVALVEKIEDDLEQSWGPDSLEEMESQRWDGAVEGEL